jgi:DNA-binding NtrC family response regulator
VEDQKTVRVLAILPEDRDYDALKEILSHSRWTLTRAQTLAEAEALMARQDFPVVLCACATSDGGWRPLVEMVTRQEQPPFVLVSSRLADDALWAEVLSAGCYDLLPIPFDRHEVFRVVARAWCHWKQGFSREPSAPGIEQSHLPLPG